MDRIRRRQIGARPFRRPALCFVFHTFHSDSIPIRSDERGKRHEFNFGEIHGTATGNLFFLIYGNSAISSFIIYNSVRSWSLFERGSYQVGLCLRRKHRRWSIRTVDRPVDAEFEIRRSSLDGDYCHCIRGVSVWRQWPLHSFHGLDVARGNCFVTLRI
jgi:hypothetical protein